MTRIRLAASREPFGRSAGTPAPSALRGARGARRTPHLKLVADTGSQYRTPPAGPGPRRHSWLTLSVAAAAVAAAFLASTMSGDRFMPGEFAMSHAEAGQAAKLIAFEPDGAPASDGSTLET